jgi:hypothetical protein
MLSSQLALPFPLHAQGGHPTPSPVPSGVKEIKCHGRPIPQLEDIAQKTGIHFEHLVAPDQKYILESMSGGVLLLDYDRDGWVDIYFTNAPTLDTAGQPARAHRGRRADWQWAICSTMERWMLSSRIWTEVRQFSEIWEFPAVTG